MKQHLELPKLTLTYDRRAKRRSKTETEKLHTRSEIGTQIYLGLRYSE